MVPDGRTDGRNGRTDGQTDGRTDDAKTISLRLCRGIKNFPKYSKMLICKFIFFSTKLLHTNVNCNHGVKTMYHVIPSKTAKRTLSTCKFKFSQLQYNPYLKDNFT